MGENVSGCVSITVETWRIATKWSITKQKNAKETKEKERKEEKTRSRNSREGEGRRRGSLRVRGVRFVEDYDWDSPWLWICFSQRSWNNPLGSANKTLGASNSFRTPWSSTEILTNNKPINRTEERRGEEKRSELRILTGHSRWSYSDDEQSSVRYILRILFESSIE